MRRILGLLLVVGLASLLVLAAWSSGGEGKVVKPTSVGTQPGGAGHGTPLRPDGSNQLAAFAQGCFWGVEHRFRQLPGVVATAVGYMGGHAANPDYEQVCSHDTGHAEAVLIEFDPARVTYEQLLAKFWSSHDPTTKDRQGPDVGSQYRSAIFTFGEAQQRAALASRDEEQRQLVQPISTAIEPAGPFWIAEEYHQQWDEKHGYESCPAPRRAARK
jgi:peptide-methionine (S)-S-oxide reductase